VVGRGTLTCLIVCLLGPPALPPEPTPSPDASSGLSLSWTAPPGCPGLEELKARVGALLPELPITDAGPVHARAELRQRSGTPERWQVILNIDSALGHEVRRFEAESCRVAAEATALVIAVALDPVATAGQLASEPNSPSDTKPKDPSTSSEDDDAEILVEVAPPERDDAASFELELPHDRPARDDHVRTGIAILAGGGYGPLRTGSAAVLARVAVFSRAWRWELRGAWLPPISHQLREDRSARFDGWLVGTRGCGVPVVGRTLTVPLCAGVEAGAVRGRPLSPILNRRDASQPWVAVELGPGLSWSPIPRLALALELGLVVPLLQAGFALDGEPALRYSRVGVRALAGIELRLP
jgi:hypothetical protein